MKNYLKAVFLVMISTLLFSCAAHQKGQDMFRPQALNVGQYDQKVDNFLVILDASGSKNNTVGGQKKLEYAKDIVSRMNQTIPNELSLNSALRRFGKGIKESQPIDMKTEIVYSPGQYFKPKFDDALATITKADGLTFMEAAIDAGSDDLKSFSGKSAVIIVSDGKVHTNDPVQAAKRMKSQYGERVCIYTIWIPSGTADINQVAKDKKLMQKIAEAGSCGFSALSNDIASSQGMADFVEKVFLTAKATPPTPTQKLTPICTDSDQDGVCDKDDDCPNTPRGVTVDSRGCPIMKPDKIIPDVRCPDTDKDGVCNENDDCPNTPRGAGVNGRGCWIIENLLFDYNKSFIRTKYYPDLDEVVRILKQNPYLNIEIQGHTCNIGSQNYNLPLSQRRAKSVRAYLMKQGIPEERMSWKGYGLKRPAASNATEEGRELNRRVELHPIR